MRFAYFAPCFGNRQHILALPPPLRGSGHAAYPLAFGQRTRTRDITGTSLRSLALPAVTTGPRFARTGATSWHACPSGMLIYHHRTVLAQLWARASPTGRCSMALVCTVHCAEVLYNSRSSTPAHSGFRTCGGGDPGNTSGNFFPSWRWRAAFYSPTPPLRGGKCLTSNSRYGAGPVQEGNQ